MIYIHFIETQFLQAVVFTTNCPFYLNFILSDSNTAEMSIFLHEAAFYQIKNTKKKYEVFQYFEQIKFVIFKFLLQKTLRNIQGCSTIIFLFVTFSYFKV
jgi:hypothetical protein